MFHFTSRYTRKSDDGRSFVFLEMVRVSLVLQKFIISAQLQISRFASKGSFGFFPFCSWRKDDYLFNELRNHDFRAMFISFNWASNLHRNEGESQGNTILRQIATQLIDKSKYSPDELQHLTCEEGCIDRYVDQQTNFRGSNEKTFILLIDELNVLGHPLSSRASLMSSLINYLLILNCNLVLLFLHFAPCNGQQTSFCHFCATHLLT